MRVTTAVYTPDPQLRTPGRLVREMMRDLLASRELAWRLFARNITTQYRQTALGYVWAVAPPLMTSFLFIMLNSANLLRAGETGVPYPVFVILGTVSFGLFLDGLNMPLNAVNGARGILPKINFPHEALLLAGLGQILVNFAVKATLVVIILVTFRVSVQPTAVLVVVPLTGLLVMGIAAGILLVPIGALFQDVVHALGVAASGLVFTSWNPLTPLIMTARDLLVHGSSPQMSTTLILVAASIAALALSWVVFRLAMPILIERMGS
jgi:homopolymeric O-antigen transport system permease protein